MARVKALLRRAKPERIAAQLVAGDVELDRETKRLRRAGREIRLGPTEFRLLEYLMEKPGRVFSRGQLLDSVWGMSAEIDERTVDVHVGRLRKAPSRSSYRSNRRTAHTFNWFDVSGLATLAFGMFAQGFWSTTAICACRHRLRGRLCARPQSAH
jgi:hypothetical protein